jgi:Ca2+-transporting ATPase
VAPVSWHARDVGDVLAGLKTAAGGLSDAEAARRRAVVGPNRLPPPPRVSRLRVLLDQLRSVVVLLLVVATAVSLTLGDVVEAVAIAAVLVINTAVGFATELRARRAMEAILHLETPQASVVRDGRAHTVDARELVPGDVIQVSAGQHVPADARLLQSTDVQADEAPLTGESLPVSKQAQTTLPAETPLADRRNMIYSGTIVVAGVARAAVTATGGSTEIGRIGELIRRVPMEPTPLERRLDALGHRLVWLSLAIAAVVAALGWAQGAPMELLLQTGIALAVAAVPEALPAVATIALAVGMHRMARRQALVRRLPAVESLGSTTVICTDKTRTLTSGEMTVVRIHPVGGTDASVLELAWLASRPDGRDPVDRAIVAAAARSGIDGARRIAALPEVALIPFSSDRKFTASIRGTAPMTAYVKGAPGRVIDLCRLEAGAREALVATNNRLAGEGLRVLAVAAGEVGDASEGGLAGLGFAGFVGLADPPAAGVKDTIARLRDAGLRTVMLTGDQRLTAEAVGRALGVLREREHVVDSRDLHDLSSDRFREAVATAGAFSRITSEDKLRIVEALQQRGDIVAMLGDGVNDAPALRKADVGVAMGIRGTDVAKEAAAIVLRDDRFETIAAAVEEGRVIFDNIRKFVFYLFSCNTAEVLVLLVAGLWGLPLPLAPLQLLWLNMLTDTFPALALAMEPAEADVMRRGPRNPDEAILSRSFVGQMVLYAGLITAATLAGFVWALAAAPSRATTIAFMTLALAQIAHLGNARSAAAVLSPRRAGANRYALAAVAVSAALQIATVVFDPLARVLDLEPLTAGEWVLVMALAAIPAVCGQALKVWRSRRRT